MFYYRTPLACASVCARCFISLFSFYYTNRTHCAVVNIIIFFGRIQSGLFLSYLFLMQHSIEQSRVHTHTHTHTMTLFPFVFCRILLLHCIICAGIVELSYTFFLALTTRPKRRRKKRQRERERERRWRWWIQWNRIHREREMWASKSDPVNSCHAIIIVITHAVADVLRTVCVCDCTHISSFRMVMR